MKHTSSISIWSMIAVAGLTVASVLAWFSYSASRPVVGLIPEMDIPDMRTFASYAPVSAEKSSVEDSRPAAADATLSPAVETEEQRAEELSKQADIARKLAELRIELDEVAGITDLQKRNEALAQICYRWGECDPRGAVALACELGLDEAGVLENLTQQWASVDLSAARAWIGAQPASEIRAHLVARVGFLWAKIEPESAANYILDEMPPGEIQTEAAISVLHQWAQQDRDAATAWARQFAAGALRERALGETLGAVARVRAD